MATVTLPQKRKTIWLTPKTRFNDSLGRLFGKPDLCCGYELTREARWDDVSVIWKPITGGPDYKNLPKLEFLSTFFTSGSTVTEKLSLLETGMAVYGRDQNWSKFFDIQPYGQSSTQKRLKVPRSYLKHYPTLGSSEWITKLTSAWGGMGIKIFTDARQLRASLNEKGQARIVQKYIEKPLLFHGRKFDLRMYVLLTPQKALFYGEGFMRVCPKLYTPPTGARVQNDGIHLTNLDQNGAEGTIHLLSELESLGIGREVVYNFIRELIPIFKYAQEVERKYHAQSGITFKTFELLGIDVIFDEEKKPWLLEINKDPATSPEGPIEDFIMGLVSDTLKEAIFYELEPSLREPTGFLPLI